MAREVESIPVDDLMVSREDPDTKEILHSYMYEVGPMTQVHRAA